MKTIRIVHLFPRLLSLYGEYGNVVYMKKLMTERGFSVEVTECEDGVLPPDGAELVYIGSGTESALLAAAERLLPGYDEVRRSTESGAVWIATGNAMALFGRSIRRGEQTLALPGIFSYETEIAGDGRYSGDVLTTAENIFGAPLVGYINTACAFHGIDAPLARLTLNPELGNDKRTAGEGMYAGRFYGTQLIGPALVKNPPFAAHVLKAVTGRTMEPDETDPAYLAYASAVGELQKRACAK